MNTTPLDQNQAIALKEHLILQSAALSATVSRLTGETIIPPKLSANDDLLADVSTLQQHVAAMQSKLDAVPAKAEKPASKSPAVTVKPIATQTASKPLSATEQVLARYGAKDLSELHANKPARNPKNLSLPAK